MKEKIAIEYDGSEGGRAMTEPVESQSPNPGGPWVPPALRTQPVDPNWALSTGLLHVLNEAVLWPIGFGIVVGQDAAGNTGLILIEASGPIVPVIPAQEHHEAHVAYMTMLAHRLQPEEESPETRAAREARSRIVLPR